MRLDSQSCSEPGHPLALVRRRCERRGLCGLFWLFAALVAQSASGIAVAQDTTQATPPTPSTKPGKSREQSKVLPRATLLATGGATDTALDSVIRAKLEELQVVKIVAVPGMDLGGVQLALDCVGETTRCLKLVATKSHAQVLVSPTLQQTPSELVLSLLRFDAADGGEMRHVLRRHPGRDVGPKLLDEVPDMLRELFDLPRSEPTQVAEAAQPSEVPAPGLETASYPETVSRGVSAGPLILGGVGVAALGAGIVMGVVMNNQQSDYDDKRMRVRTESQARAAADVRSAGERSELAANVLFAVGGAALVAAGVWLAIDLSGGSESESPTAFAPAMGPHSVGLVLTHRGESL
jgi:hypothetical protein